MGICVRLAFGTLQTALRKGNGEKATQLYEVSQELIGNSTDDVDWYQVLLHHIPDDEAAATLRALWGALLLQSTTLMKTVVLQSAVNEATACLRTFWAAWLAPTHCSTKGQLLMLCSNVNARPDQLLKVRRLPLHLQMPVMQRSWRATQAATTRPAWVLSQLLPMIKVLCRIL